MVYLDEQEIAEAYELACNDAEQWRKEYTEFERLADNGLLENLDENLPEVNDGSLAASLFKLAKRVIKKKMTGQARALDRDDAWLTELANIIWDKDIIPNAKSKASPRRKWKDAVRKAAIYGGQPIIVMMVNGKVDFFCPYAQDVKLEAGKDSDADCDIKFWDVYYSEHQIKNMLADAQEEMDDFKVELEAYKNRQAIYEQALAQNPELPPFDEVEPEPFNEWNIDALTQLSKTKPEDHRPGNEQHRTEQLDTGVVKTGYHLYVSFQKGVGSPFHLMDPTKGKNSPDAWLRKWSNPDPTGEDPVFYLYCYQDFINPYGIGIVKLAGGTQNVLDYMRQADILATQIGISPPQLIGGNEDEVDEDSMVMAGNAKWYIGNATVTPWNSANNTYQSIPERISMYQTSLQKFIPMGDTTISSTSSGDPLVGKTPQALQMQAQSLSIDDEDISENVDETYAAVAACMINYKFANTSATDIFKLSEDERERLEKAGIPFNVDELTGEKSNELEVVWDNCRAQFEFEVDADADTTSDEATKLEGLTTVLNMLENPAALQLAMGQPIMLGNKMLNPGELVGEIISLTTDNDKILTDATPEDQQLMQQQAMAQPGAVDPTTGQPIQAQQLGMPTDPSMGAQPPMAQDTATTPEEDQAGEKIQQIQELYNVSPEVAAAMLEAEDQGAEPEEVLAAMERAGIVPKGTAPDMSVQGAVNG